MGSGISKYLKKDPAVYASRLGNPDGDASLDDVRHYDYVVVGGGTAGCVLAARLSEDESVTVLLLEAGKRRVVDYRLTQPPMAWPQLMETDADWKYKTTPLRFLKDKVINIPRGHVLGGTLSINAGIYHHASPSDFDEWERDGATGWSYETLKPYFAKSENFRPGSSGRSGVERGKGGPWQTTNTGVAPCDPYIIDACQTLGFKKRLQYLCWNSRAGNFMGFVDAHGRRSSTATGYLTPEVLARPNLTVAVGVMVEKLLSRVDDDGTPLVFGVRLSISPQEAMYVVRADREVILSGGVIATPQILLVSGFGPKSDLETLKIPVAKDLPAVGRNLYDHASPGPIIFRAKPAVTWDRVVYNPLRALYELARWYFTGGGPFGCIVPGPALFFRSDDPLVAPIIRETIKKIQDNTSGPNSPDIEVTCFPLIVPAFGEKPSPNKTGITFAGFLLRPSSSGTITISSDNVWDKPLIDMNFFAEDSDVQVAIAITLFLLRLARTSPLKEVLDLKEHSTDQNDLFWPGDASPDKITEDEIRAHLLKQTQSGLHPSSSARMGSSPLTSVVDPTLKVHGVKGLRIVDASVFPSAVSGHPVATVVAIAERASDLVREEHSSK